MKIEFRRSRRFVTFISMADISFLLLIFEILFMSVIEKERVELPTFSFSQKTAFPDTVTVIVLGRDSFLVDERESSFDGLRQVLLAHQDEESIVVDVFADRNIDYAVVDRVLSSCEEAGIRHVLLEAVKENE
jgi:biopolymer transport protein ExbD